MSDEIFIGIYLLVGIFLGIWVNFKWYQQTPRKLSNKIKSLIFAVINILFFFSFASPIAILCAAVDADRIENQ